MSRKKWNKAGWMNWNIYGQSSGTKQGGFDRQSDGFILLLVWRAMTMIIYSVS